MAAAGREIQNDDRDLGPPDHGKHGRGERVGCDVEKDEINVGLAEFVAGREGFLRRIDQPQIHHLGARPFELPGDLLARIPLDDPPGRETAANTHPGRFRRAQSSARRMLWSGPLANLCRHKSYSLQTAEL